jgi:UDP-N-acetylglucosamine 2-epimerase (non-hydrolysing)
MSYSRLLHVVGARPNFMKAAPVIQALEALDINQQLVHTGQHYDTAMSGAFFDQLGLPVPDFNLEVGAGSHATQTARIMERFEHLMCEQKPDTVIVYGDVNSTLACALVAAKLGIPVAHVEAGLRSNDRTMPEEINRILTDQLADLLFTPSPDADEHLRREGIPPCKIHLVGNVMIDTLIRLLPSAHEHVQKSAFWVDSGVGAHYDKDGFVLATFHRPANVDEPDNFHNILQALVQISDVHPCDISCAPADKSKN